MAGRSLEVWNVAYYRSQSSTREEEKGLPGTQRPETKKDKGDGGVAVGLQYYLYTPRGCCCDITQPTGVFVPSRSMLVRKS